MRAKIMDLSGWGRTLASPSSVYRPERQSHLRQLMALPEPFIARGGGRSYGDQAVCGGGATILTERLDRFISFDARTGLLEAEAGLTFADLYRVMAGRGWVAPVTPGTGRVTLGGALANDVHGKNHERDGSFAHHVQWFDLITPDGAIRRVSRQSDSDLFNATAGGCGLTGIITALALQMAPITHPSVNVRCLPANDLEAMLTIFHELAPLHRFSVAWIDGTAVKGKRGGGIVELADWADTPVKAPAPRSRRVPFDAPGWLLNPLVMSVFNQLYRRISTHPSPRLRPAGTFFYPLDALDDWNRLYGRRGFVQFQCVIPTARAEAALPRLLEAAGTPYLVVLKRLGDMGDGMLSFPMPGYTLALDYPWSDATAERLKQLSRITRDHDGRIYLAKDACADPADVVSMYPRLDRFRQILARIDPAGRLRSEQSRRLHLHGHTP